MFVSMLTQYGRFLKLLHFKPCNQPILSSSKTCEAEEPLEEVTKHKKLQYPDLNLQYKVANSNTNVPVTQYLNLRRRTSKSGRLKAVVQHLKGLQHWWLLIANDLLLIHPTQQYTQYTSVHRNITLVPSISRSCISPVTYFSPFFYHYR